MYLSHLAVLCQSVWTHCLDTLRYYDRSVKLPKLSVWFHVVGPILSAGTVTIAECLNMFHKPIAPTIHHLYGDINMWHQPEHPHIMIGNSFPDQWQGRRGSGDSSSWSSDLIPPDLSLWSYIKYAVHSTQPKELQELQQESEAMRGCPSRKFGGCLSSQSFNTVNRATKPTVRILTYTRFTNASAEYHGLVSYSTFHLTN